MLIRYVKAIGDLQASIRDALGWLFPERRLSGGWSWTEKGSWIYQPPTPVFRDKTFGKALEEWIKLGEAAVEGANRMSRVEYEALLAQQRIRAKAKTDVKIKTEPSTNPDDGVPESF